MLKRAEFPEQVGVDSEIVERYICYLESINLRTDSLMVIRNGKVACECHWSPVTADTPHEMYSLSKSVTSTAVGIAYD